MKIRRAPISQLISWAALLVVIGCVSASAQTTTPPPPIQGTTPPIQGVTTIVPAATAADTLTNLVRPVGAPQIGQALGLATKLAIGTAPFGAAQGGFLIKLDPSTGLQVRTATTFGPSFAERALTNGEGKVSAGVNFTSVTFDLLDDLELGGLLLRSVTGGLPAQGRSGTENVKLTAQTIVTAGRMGVSDKLDIGMVLPIVTLTVDGTTTLRNGFGDTILFAQGSNVSKGLGDIAGLVKYRFVSFGSGQPDPGGMALMGTVRLPTVTRKPPWPRRDIPCCISSPAAGAIPAACQRWVRVVEQRRERGLGRSPEPVGHSTASVRVRGWTRARSRAQDDRAHRPPGRTDFWCGQTGLHDHHVRRHVNPVAGRLVRRHAKAIVGPWDEGESQRQAAAHAERTGLAAGRRFAHPRHARGGYWATS
jgi:hypothetical protein